MFTTDPALQWAAFCAILDQKNRIPSRKLGEGPQIGIFYIIIIIVIIIIIAIVIAIIITTTTMIIITTETTFPCQFYHDSFKYITITL